MKRLMLWLIRGYKKRISPLFPPSCRFYPTCSQYMMESIEKHGLFRGGFMGIRRLSRCHPLSKGGFDPVK